MFKGKAIVNVVLFALTSVIIFSGCKKEDPPLPPNQISFAATSLGFEPASTELTINLQLSRAEAAPLTAKVRVEADGLTPGNDFTTVPALKEDGTIDVSIAANTTAISFKVIKATGVLLSGNESIVFTLMDTDPVTLGSAKAITVSMSTIVSEGQPSLIFPGKTAESNYANGVYVDLSNNAVIAVNRKSWNLGFTSNSLNRVVLNPGYLGKALKLNKTDITTPISTADTTGTNLNFGAYSTPLSAADDFTGDLSKTVFGDIATNEAEAKVVVCAFDGSEDPANWYRVKVNSTASGYKVQYAKYKESTVKTVNITKDSDFNLMFLSLESGTVVSAEPRAKNWDIQWSYVLNYSGTITYSFQDFVLLNYMAGAQAAEVVETDATADAKYNAFNESNIAGLSFLSTRNAIRDKWRVTTGTGIKRDRFYIIKDPNGNYYKLRFKKMGLGSDGGERGKPEIEYKLVKKA